MTKMEHRQHIDATDSGGQLAMMVLLRLIPMVDVPGRSKYSQT